jgi:hypothetical protein
MTTKSVQKRGASRKGKPAEKAADGRTREELMCVSADEFEVLIDTVRGGGGLLYEDDEAIGAFLLLIHSVANADDGTRFNYINSAERMLVPYTSAFEKAAASVLEVSSSTLKKGGGRVMPTTKKGKPARPLEIYDANGAQRNPLTSREVVRVVNEIGDHLVEYEETSALFLLLLYALANADESDRAEAYYSACRRLAYTPEGSEEFFEASHVRALASFRKGGE